MSRSNQNQKRVDSCSVPFHALVSASLSGGAAAITVSPSGLNFVASRLGTEADAWAHFKVRSLEFRLHHGAITGDYAAGYVGGIQDAPPSSTVDVMQLLPATYQGVSYTKPSDWVKISKKDLAGPFPWYKSVAGTADATEEAPGQICIAGVGTDIFVMELRGVFDFKTAVAPANTPMLLKLREEARKERVREEQKVARKSLLKVLASTGTACP